MNKRDRERALRRQEKLLDAAFIEQQVKAEVYTAKWFATLDWAQQTIEGATGDFTEWEDASPRVEKVRGAVVRDLEDDEEAWRKARPIAELEEWLWLQITNRESGRRRVVIRLLTWEVDRENEVMHHPEWLKWGDDLSPRQARAAALRHARAYAEVLEKGQESREIRMTAIEIAFWTARDAARTL